MDNEPIRTYLLARWPAYTRLLVAGLGGGLLLIVVSGALGRWDGVLALALLLLGLNYFLAASLWLARQSQDIHFLANTLWQLGQLGQDDRLAIVDLGLRRLAIALRSRLRKGRIIAIDVYNPQLSPHRALVRLRQVQYERSYDYQTDVRMEALEGRLDFLPLPDNYLPIVIMNQTLVELFQPGDRATLLREIYRILTPGGRLLLVEPARSWANWWLQPWLAGVPFIGEWEALFNQTAFQERVEQPINALLWGFVLHKPALPAPQQLALPF